jgi:hypothetical protein
MKPDRTEPLDPDGPVVSAVEAELRRALRPVDPPAGFTDRVLQRAALQTGRAAERPARAVPGLSLARWATAAALVLAVSGGLWYRAEERRRERGEEARRQVLLSLEITGTKLRAVQLKLNRLPSQGESRQ